MRMSSRGDVARAKTLRREMSPAEVKLWQLLRERPGGFKFRHQHPAGRYTLDFYCARAALCVEVDGNAHEMGNNPQRDARRDAWLLEQGIQTLRIPAAEVFWNPEAVILLIQERCAARSPSTAFGGPPPLQMRGRTI